jgi:hypothetical protein
VWGSDANRCTQRGVIMLAAIIIMLLVGGFAWWMVSAM